MHVTHVCPKTGTIIEELEEFTAYPMVLDVFCTDFVHNIMDLSIKVYKL